eukprot:1376787-Rhodomonas_salina.1
MCADEHLLAMQVLTWRNGAISVADGEGGCAEGSEGGDWRAGKEGGGSGGGEGEGRQGTS